MIQNLQPIVRIMSCVLIGLALGSRAVRAKLRTEKL